MESSLVIENESLIGIINREIAQISFTDALANKKLWAF